MIASFCILQSIIFASASALVATRCADEIKGGNGPFVRDVCGGALSVGGAFLVIGRAFA